MVARVGCGMPTVLLFCQGERKCFVGPDFTPTSLAAGGSCIDIVDAPNQGLEVDTWGVMCVEYGTRPQPIFVYLLLCVCVFSAHFAV